MAKRFSVRSVDDSFHWHGSSGTIEISSNLHNYLQRTTLLIRLFNCQRYAQFPCSFFCWSWQWTFVLHFPQLLITESQKGGAEWRLNGRNSCTPSQSCYWLYSPVLLACTKLVWIICKWVLFRFGNVTTRTEHLYFSKFSETEWGWRDHRYWWAQTLETQHAEVKKCSYKP